MYQAIMSVRRSITVTARPLQAQLSFTSVSRVYREYHGDPGPSTNQNQALRQQRGIRTSATTKSDTQQYGQDRPSRSPPLGRSNGRNDVHPDIRSTAQSKVIPNHRLNTSDYSPAIPQRYLNAAKSNRKLPRRVFAGPSDRLIDPGARIDTNGRVRQPGPNLGQAPDSYDTARALKIFMASNPSPMNDFQLNEAYKIVAFAPVAAQNAVVWNQLLALTGREGKMDRLWKTFNDVS